MHFERSLRTELVTVVIETSWGKLAPCKHSGCLWNIGYGVFLHSMNSAGETTTLSTLSIWCNRSVSMCSSHTCSVGSLLIDNGSSLLLSEQMRGYWHLWTWLTANFTKGLSSQYDVIMRSFPNVTNKPNGFHASSGLLIYKLGMWYYLWS